MTVLTSHAHLPPAVSILVPVYNREALIGACLESALGQTIGHLEVVVVDNASTDGTWTVIQWHAQRDPRVRAFRNPRNLGPVLNWKRCVEEARAPLAKLLFSDDLIAPRFLEATMPWLDDPATGFVFVQTAIGERPDRAAVAYSWLPRSGTEASRRFVRDAVPARDAVPVSPGAALFRLVDLRANLREQLPSPAGIDLAAHGAGPDVLLYLLTALQYPRVAYVAETLAFFRSHPDSMTVENPDGRVSEGYALAYAWFATHHMHFPRRERALASIWITKTRQQRHLRHPRTVLGRYVASPSVRLVTLFGVAELVARVLAQPARRFFRWWRRAPRPASS